MNLDFFVIFHFIVVCHGAGTFYKHIMRVTSDYKVSFFQLWNLTNVHCGVNETTDLYRHDWVDRFDVSCIHSLYLFFDTTSSKFYKYTMFNDGENLETVLTKVPAYMEPSARYNNRNAGDQYLVNDGKYDFLSLNPAGDAIYVGIFHDTTSSSYPTFVFNPLGSPYTAGQDPTGFTNIQTFSVVDIKAALHDTPQCQTSFASTVNNAGDCPTLPNVTTTTTSPSQKLNGATLSLDCSHSATMVSDVYWMFQATSGTNTRIDSTSDPSKYAGSTKASPSLDVYSFSASDQGKYTCFVQNIIGLDSSADITATLIAGPPTVTITGNIYELILGNTVKLLCSATGTPAVDTIRWTRNSSPIADCGSSGRISGMTIGQPSLILSNLEMCDAAVYQCCAQNTQGDACSSNIILNVKPNVTVSDSPVITVKENAQITINCTVESNIAVTAVYWNIRIASGIITYTGGSSPKYSGSTTVSPSIVITSPGDTDVGQYICVGTNAIGNTESSLVQLVVYGVTATVAPLSVSVVYGDNAQLGCTVTGVPDVTSVKWEFHHNGTDIDMTNTAKYLGSSVADPSLQILEVTFDDASDYHCVAENAYHSHTSDGDVTVTVTGAIPTVNTNQQFVTANQSESVTLFCGATGSPTVQSIYWKKKAGSTYTNVPGTVSGGTVASPPLVFSNPQPTDSGLYVCFASNALGEASSAAVNLTINTVEAMCPCACYYQERLSYWAAKNATNYTMEELRIILAPVLNKLEKELRLDTNNLSATINKRNSAKDSRQSSTSLGILGIAFLAVVLGGIAVIDLTSLPRYFTVVKQICKIKG